MTKERLNEILGAADVICGECSGMEEDCENCWVRNICDDSKDEYRKNNLHEYLVTLLVTGYHTVHITASDEKEAEALAVKNFNSNPCPILDNKEVSVWEIIKEES